MLWRMGKLAERLLQARWPGKVACHAGASFLCPPFVEEVAPQETCRVQADASTS